MKKILILLIVLLILPSIAAINLTVEKQSVNEVFISELGKPVEFDLKITNNGLEDEFDFYNLVGFNIESPSEKIKIKKGETKDVKLKISPIGEFNQKGNYKFKYYIQGKDKTEITEERAFR